MTELICYNEDCDDWLDNHCMKIEYIVIDRNGKCRFKPIDGSCIGIKDVITDILNRRIDEVTKGKVISTKELKEKLTKGE